MATGDNANFERSYPYLIEENYVNHHDASVVTSRNREETIAVDSLPPNQFGLYNMYGNVSEWEFLKQYARDEDGRIIAVPSNAGGTEVSDEQRN